MNAKKKILALSGIIILLTPLVASATSAPLTQFEDPLGGTGNIRTLIWNLIYMALSFAGVISLLGIVYGGLVIIIGGMRSEQDLSRGKQIIFWAIIGLVIVGMSAVILVVIGNDLLGLGSVTL